MFLWKRVLYAGTLHLFEGAVIAKNSLFIRLNRNVVVAKQTFILLDYNIYSTSIVNFQESPIFVRVSTTPLCLKKIYTTNLRYQTPRFAVFTPWFPRNGPPPRVPRRIRRFPVGVCGKIHGGESLAAKQFA